MNRAPFKTKLRVEPLEARNLLAGNVSAFITDGNLFVNGDAASNSITIESAGPNTVQVRGFNDGSGVATRVNGEANGLRLFSGFNGDIFINMRAGDDVVRLTNLVVPGEVHATFGAGNDEFLTGETAAGDNARFGGTPSGPLFVQGDFKAYMSAGNDRLFQSNVEVQGNGFVHLGSDNDTLQMQRPVASGENVEYDGTFTVQLDHGNDTVDVLGLIVGNNLLVDNASGQVDLSMRSMDVFGDFRIYTDEAADNVLVSSTNVRGELGVFTAAGNDVVNISAIAQRLVVNSGSDNDDVHINSASIDKIYLQLGTGNDSLDLLNVYTDRIDTFGNSGDDVFLVRNTNAIDAFFHGDAGFDTYRESNLLPNRINNLRKFSIERNQRV